MPGEVRVYRFNDLNAVASGDESPEETEASAKQNENPQPVLRRRWRQENPDALRDRQRQP